MGGVIHPTPKRRYPKKDFIWSPDLAYAVGLLVTDGNLSNDARHITMRSAEIVMLDNFKCCLGLSNKVSSDRRNGNTYFRVQFGNVQFYDWLMRIGLMPAKSLIIGAIEIPDKYFPDYLRGCIDGDGSIITYPDTYNCYKGRQYTTQRLFIKVVSASERHIVWLRDRIRQLTRLHGAIIKKHPRDEKHVPLWELKFAKKESLQIIQWIYYLPSVPCLERKRITAERAVEIIKNQKRKPREPIA